jgi:hypothetical protein
MKRHAGSGRPQGSLHRGTAPRPSPTHAGSGRPKGVVHEGVQPRQYGGTHGGTALPMGKLSGKRK